MQSSKIIREREEKEEAAELLLFPIWIFGWTILTFESRWVCGCDVVTLRCEAYPFFLFMQLKTVLFCIPCVPPVHGS